MAIKERLIQLTLKARDLFSGEVERSSAALSELRSEADRLKKSLEDDSRARSLARNLRDTRAATDDLERAWRTAEANLADLTSEIGENETATAGQRIALREARKTAEDAERAYKRNQTALRNLSGELKSLGVDTKSLSAEEQRLGAAVDQGKTALAEARAEMRRVAAEEKAAAKAAEEHRQRVDGVRGAMASGVRQIVAYAAAFVGVNAALGLLGRGFDAIKGGIVSMLQTGDEFEGLQTRLTALMGSVEAGEQATAWITKFAKDTPLQLSEVTDAFALMKAYGLDPMDGTFKALEDQSEKLGGGMDRLTGIATAVGQAWAKQKLQTEEILQLVERGVPVWDMLSQVTGKNVVQLQDLASKGKLGRDVIKELIGEMERSSAGAAAANMSRLSGLISNLQDTATNFLNRIAKSGALDFVKGKLEELADTIAEMDKDGSLDRLAKGLSDAFVQGVEKVEQFIKKLGEVDFKKLTDDSATWLSNFGDNVDKAVRQIQLVTTPVRVAFNVLTLAASGVAAAMTGIFSKTFKVIASMAKAVPDALGGDKLTKAFDTASQKLAGIASGAVDQVKQDAEDLKNTWDKLSGDVASSAEKQAEAAKSGAEKSAAAAVDAAEAVNQALLKLAEEGKLRIGSLSSAMELIASAKTTQQVEALRGALLKAYQDGALTQEQFSQATGLLGSRLKEVGTQAAASVQAAGTGAAKGVETANDALMRLISEGKVGLADMAQALDLISTAKTREQLEQFRTVLLKAFQAGKLSQDDYANATSVLNAKLKDMGKAAGGAALGVSDLSDGLESLKDVQNAIASAKTSADIQNIRTALNKLYNDGKIKADEFNQSQKALSDKIAEMKAAGVQGAEGMDALSESTDKATDSLEEQRKAIGDSMEAQRQASGFVKEDMTAFAGFFASVMTSARQPLAQLSQEALAAFDTMRGLSSADLKIDTSSVESTTQSLERMREEMGRLQGAASLPGVSSLGKWALTMKADSDAVAVSFLEQKRDLLSLLDGYDKGEISAASFVEQAKAARNGMNLLNDSDLRQLESTIDSAKQRMEQLSKGSRDTLVSLQEELAGLRGEQDAVDRSKFASRQRDLQQQLADAQAGGDLNAVQNLMEALGTLKQIEEVTNFQRQQADQQKRVDAQNGTSAGAAVPAATPQAPPFVPTQIIELRTASGPVRVAVDSDQNATGLLGILEQAGKRTS
ncbi:tape measure protein [Pseudomonas sp. QL9]|uniref:tape measure protein n=1 Tax=Pseudomonas sp. QL9 TaxID=3242725 RepID=UPI00352B224D